MRKKLRIISKNNRYL